MRPSLAFLTCVKKSLVLIFEVIVFLIAFDLAFSGELKKLDKIGEIGPVISNKKDLYFWHITDIGCDDEGNLYVADSGWNKIFKFNARGEFLFSFGQEGQGPGEFLGQPHAYHLKLSVGKNKLIYILDRGNRRISLFDYKGQWIKSFPWPKNLTGSPAINSQGYFYFINSDRKAGNVITCLDHNFHYVHNLLEAEWHFHFPFYKPDKEFYEVFFPDSLIIMITQADELVALSNCSLEVYHFDKNHRLKNRFSVINDYFKEDFKSHLKKAIAHGGIAIPFWAFLDPEDNLCLIYPKKSDKRHEIYRYNLKGNLIDLILCPEEKTRKVACMNREGRLFIILEADRIGFYKLL